MATPEKQAAVAMLTDHFQNASAAVVTEYRGLTVSQLNELRLAFGANAKYLVAKNTLARKAAENAGVPLVEHLKGPTAIAVAYGDISVVAKALRDFAKDYPHFSIKGGHLDGKPIDSGEIAQLADLEPREVLLARFAGAIEGAVVKPARLAKAIPSKVVYATVALQEKTAA